MSTDLRRRGQSNRRSCPVYLRVRIKSVQARVSSWGVDALLVSNPRDIRYLTGFVGDDSWAVVFARSSKVVVISDSRFEEQIQRESPHVTVKMRRAGLIDELAKVMDRRRVKQIALQENDITLMQRRILVKKLGAKRLLAVDDGMLRQRAVKDKDEIKAIQRALQIQQEAFRHAVRQLKPGQSEQEVAALLEYEMRACGADGCSFPTIVAAGSNASLPHATPGRRKIKKGNVILIDWGAKWKGYCSDLTRIVAFGKVPPKIKKIYEIVYEAQQAAIETIAPGKALQQIDAVARRVIEKAGYGKQFGHSLGHGIGLDIHEQPTLSAKSSGCLEPGHVVTVEPGIYLPGVGGVRIEDDVLVTKQGHRVLSDLPADLESTII